jgi:dTDP-4-dehydrorhamnose 3,5-epimerase
MILRETSLTGAFVVELERLDDERGHFARTFDREQFAAAGLDGRVVQASTSFNLHAGTLRGMHYQAEPHAEAKLVRATRGAVYDVIVDLRSGSPTRCQWFAVQLDAETGRALYVPPGFAHGFQTLEDASEVLYQMSYPYVSDAARGVRFDDPVFAIEWPAPPTGKRIVSQRDREFADYEPA